MERIPTNSFSTPDFRLLFESVPGLYLVLTPDLVIVAASNDYLSATMTAREEILGRGLFEVFPDNPDDPVSTGARNLRSSLSRVLQTGLADTMPVQQYDIRRPESEGGAFEERFWSPVNSPVFDTGGSIVYIVHRVEDVTDFVRLKNEGTQNQKAAEESRMRADKMDVELFLRAQELAEANRQLEHAKNSLEGSVRLRTEEWQRVNHLLNSVIEASPQAIIALDRAQTVQMWNPAARRIFGWTSEEVLGQPLPFVNEENQEESIRLIAAALGGESSTNLEIKRTRRDGSPVELLVSVAPIRDTGGAISGFVAVAADISERKELERQFLRAQRMESIGILAGGIAHDLNNVLSPVLMAVQLLRTHMPDESSQNMLNILESNTKRGAALIRQILTFARGIQGERVVLQPRHLLGEIEKVMEQTLPKSVRIVTEIATDLWVLSADATQLHQVFMNLCVNARDAMPEGGQLTLRAQNALLDETYARMNREAKPGPYVVVEVADTGHGIPTDIRDSVFEPFFTTKELGSGTGLGLSTVSAIVKNHNGFINLYSEVGRGTSFKLFFPALPARDAHGAAGLVEPIPLGKGELVLVVDDESAVRDITRLTLEHHGYRVLTAGDGVEGVEIFIQNRADIRLVISDMDMPIMNGGAMIRSLEAIAPSVRVISASGLPRDSAMAGKSGQPGRAFLSKPFTAEQLLRTVDAMLPGS